MGDDLTPVRLPEHALALIESKGAPVSLLVTDVIMPGMSGPELARQLLRLYPGLRVMYMSGYTDDELSQHGVLAPDVVLLPKPFDPKEFARTVREVLKGTAQPT